MREIGRDSRSRLATVVRATWSTNLEDVSDIFLLLHFARLYTTLLRMCDWSYHQASTKSFSRAMHAKGVRRGPAGMKNSLSDADADIPLPTAESEQADNKQS